MGEKFKNETDRIQQLCSADDVLADDNSGPDNMVSTRHCSVVFFTDINVLCDFMSVFVANRCMFVVTVV